MWTAAAHVITAVIGSGVLSLAWSIAQLGWVAGPAAMLVFAGVTALQSTLFADCYRSPDPEHGPHRNRTYAGAVDRNLGTSCLPRAIPTPPHPFVTSPLPPLFITDGAVLRFVENGRFDCSRCCDLSGANLGSISFSVLLPFSV